MGINGLVVSLFTVSYALNISNATIDNRGVVWSDRFNGGWGSSKIGWVKFWGAQQQNFRKS